MSVSTVPGRHARMLRILEQLLAGGEVNARTLAGQMDVCSRTIFRDLEIMRQAGIEVSYDEKLDLYRMEPKKDLVPTPTLERDELTVLVAAVHLSVLRELPDCSELLSSSISKLLANSPRQVQHHVTRLLKSCSVRAAEDAPQTQVPRIVHHILAAISQRKLLRVTVRDPDEAEVIETKFAPYQMVAALDRWHVVGRSSHHKSVRSFDPSHLTQPKITEEVYAIPRGFQCTTSVALA